MHRQCKLTQLRRWISGRSLWMVEVTEKRKKKNDVKVHFAISCCEVHIENQITILTLDVLWVNCLVHFHALRCVQCEYEWTEHSFYAHREKLVYSGIEQIWLLLLLFALFARTFFFSNAHVYKNKLTKITRIEQRKICNTFWFVIWGPC